MVTDGDTGLLGFSRQRKYYNVVCQSIGRLETPFQVVTVTNTSGFIKSRFEDSYIIMYCIYVLPL